MNSKTVYWLGFAATTAIFISSGFSLIKFLLEDQDSIDLLEKEEEITDEVKVLHNVITSEFAVKIMSYIQQSFQKEFDSLFGNLVDQRRRFLYNTEEYEKISKDIITKSDQLFNSCVEKILKSLDIKFSLEQIMAEIGKLSSEGKERLFYQYDKMKINSNLTIDQIKKAYELYHSAFQNEMKILQELAKSVSESDDQKVLFAYQVMIGQLRASDVLYMKYKITDKELIYLIYDTKLIDSDPHIQQLHRELHQMDNMFTNNIYS